MTGAGIDVSSGEEFCPICHQGNLCGNLNRKAEGFDCWCLHEPIDQRLLASLPDDLRGKACICQSCAQKFSNSNTLNSREDLAYPVK